MEDWESEIDKKSKGPVVAIILLVLVILGLVVYIGYDKEILFKKKVPVQTEKKEVKEPLEELYIESDFVQKYFQIYKEDSCSKATIYKELNSSMPAKLYLTYLQLSNDLVQEVNCDDVSENIGREDYFCGNYEEADVTTSFEENLFLLKYRELFGQKATYKLEDFEVEDGLYHYNKELKGYVFYGKEENSCTTGDISLERATLKGNILTLYMKQDNSMLENQENKEIIYILEKEKETGNYIFKSRSEKSRSEVEE